MLKPVVHEWLEERQMFSCWPKVTLSKFVRRCDSEQNALYFSKSLACETIPLSPWLKSCCLVDECRFARWLPNYTAENGSSRAPSTSSTTHRKPSIDFQKLRIRTATVGSGLRICRCMIISAFVQSEERHHRYSSKESSRAIPICRVSFFSHSDSRRQVGEQKSDARVEQNIACVVTAAVQEPRVGLDTVSTTCWRFLMTNLLHSSRTKVRVHWPFIGYQCGWLLEDTVCPQCACNNW